jgi:hypothetical protein
MLAPTLELGFLTSVGPACALLDPRAAPRARSDHAKGADADRGALDGAAHVLLDGGDAGVVVVAVGLLNKLGWGRFLATPLFSLRGNAIAKEPGSSYPEGWPWVSWLGASLVAQTLSSLPRLQP